MPSSPPIVECDNCGVRGMWEHKPRAKVKMQLPNGWKMLKHVAGKVDGMAYFHDQNCEDVYKEKHEWFLPEDYAFAGYGQMAEPPEDWVDPDDQPAADKA